MSHLGRLLVLTIVVLMSTTVAMAQLVLVEEDDPSVTYSGVWFTNGTAGNSGGSAVLTNLRGAQAVITFTGTGITWIGVKDPWSGFATVIVDGTSYRVDTYGDETIYETPLFTVRGLSNGPHTMSIEVLHDRDVSGSGSWVWIDAFVIENGNPVSGGFSAGAGRVEDNDPALVYKGNWFVHTNSMHSGGTAALCVDGGARVTLNFNGSGVSWIGYSDEWSGIANVYLDGQVGAVDTYASPSSAQTTLYRIDGLPPGKHTLTIEVTATHGAASHEPWIWVDAFDVRE